MFTIYNAEEWDFSPIVSLIIGWAQSFPDACIKYLHFCYSVPKPKYDVYTKLTTTIPQSPKLQTRQRERPPRVPTSQERELMELEQMKQYVIYPKAYEVFWGMNHKRIDLYNLYIDEMILILAEVYSFCKFTVLSCSLFLSCEID